MSSALRMGHREILLRLGKKLPLAREMAPRDLLYIKTEGALLGRQMVFSS